MMQRSLSALELYAELMEQELFLIVKHNAQ
jgi:hypothetical protein